MICQAPWGFHRRRQSAALFRRALIQVETRRLDEQVRHHVRLGAQSKDCWGQPMSDARRLAVIIPGIMGSILYGRNSALWSDSISDNYRRMISNPAQLQWTGEAAPRAELWEYVRLGPLRFVKVKLWERTLRYLQSHQEFGRDRIIACPYDWRQSLQTAATTVIRLIEQRVRRKLALEPNSMAPRLVLLTHSMGGLLLRVGVAKGELHPSWIDRVVHMAPPLLGAPVAFRSMVQQTTMPLLNEILRMSHMRNYPLFAMHMYRAFQTFPSMYELMPPKHVAYIVEGGLTQTNPLSETFLNEELISKAIATHTLIDKANDLFNQFKVKVFVIATDFHQKRRTDWEYRVQPLPAPTNSYSILERYESMFGDGTVLSFSASSAPGAEILRIADVEHAMVPNSRQAVSLLPNCGV